MAVDRVVGCIGHHGLEFSKHDSKTKGNDQLYDSCFAKVKVILRERKKGKARKTLSEEIEALCGCPWRHIFHKIAATTTRKITAATILIPTIVPSDKDAAAVVDSEHTKRQEHKRKDRPILPLETNVPIEGSLDRFVY